MSTRRITKYATTYTTRPAHFIWFIYFSRVIIKRATTESLLSGNFAAHHGAKGGTEVPLEEKKSADEYKESYTFKWQEKIFNRVLYMSNFQVIR